MENTYLELTILSAADLKRKWLSGDQTVAVAWVDPSTKTTTSVASGNGSNVQWNEKMILTLNGADTLLQGKLLTIEIHARGTWGDSLLGSVYVPLVELALDGEKRGNTTLMYQIVRPSGKREGSIKFFAKVVKRRVSGSVGPLPSAPPIEDNGTGLGWNAFYPISESSPYPPQPRLSQNYAAEHNGWQHDLSPYPSYQMGSHSPHVYPPVNATYSPHTSPDCCSNHSNYIGIIPHPPPSPQFLETPYPPAGFVYPPPTETPYPPVAPYRPYLPIAPHPSETNPPTSLYPYSNLSSPLYPPPYCQQQAAVHYPYPSYSGTAARL